MSFCLELLMNNLIRQRIRVTGVVQGVGFRPFVYGLALEHGLTGLVGNDSGGVFIEVEGSEQSVAVFREELVDHPPPLAHIESATVESLAIAGDKRFLIVKSEVQATRNTLISPDICICYDCLGELRDAKNRRFAYPFINCTNCGPRFSIIRDIPYDRPLTTMAGFPMCSACQEEYENPLDRRFHAQPNACPVCGPQVWLELTQGSDSILPNGERVIRDPDIAIRTAQQMLADGLIVAVKGLGGFHLACDAINDVALTNLRERKGRVDKPFAVMALDVDTVRQFAELSGEEEELLTSKERPILLLRKKAGKVLSDLVAPGNRYIGVMVPYTPLHYVLLGNNNQQLTVNSQQSTANVKRLPVLVMTSGNHSDEPIVFENDKARKHLSSLADAFLFHDRDIYARCDDSVVRILELGCGESDGEGGRLAAGPKQYTVLPIRRSRGYAPFPVRLPFSAPPILAVGGELKATFCLTKDAYAYVSQHIGDMENLETLLAFEAAVSHFQHIFRTKPRKIACDLHPRYLSTRWALEQAGDDLPVVQVQHHHAHIASVMAEHQLDGTSPVIGFSFDGTGYGSDGAVWGGEVLLADYRGFERAASLKYVPLVGGDAAVKRPYRLALAHLWAAGIEWDARLPSVKACPEIEANVIRKQLETGLNSVPTSSMGRLFDAVASLSGIRQTITYEGQAAIELEALIDTQEPGKYVFTLEEKVFDAAPVIQAVVRDIMAGVDAGLIAARFHNGLADLILRLSIQLRQQTGLNKVALSGGVFQNISLLQQAMHLLLKNDFEVLNQQLVPANDGGLALGQASVAAARE